MAMVVQAVLKKFGSEVLLHSPYSLDFVPPEYHLFRSPTNEIHNHPFKNGTGLKTRQNELSKTRPENF